MKEIKFRGKYKNKWVYGYFYEECENAYIIENLNKKYLLHRNCSYRVDSNTIGQFTGLKDKNGTDIYEGDMLFNDCEVYVCEWDKEYSCFCFKYDKNNRFTIIQDALISFYIIGNIYDNSDLI